MLAIDNSQSLFYEDMLRNKLSTAFSWAIGGNDITNAGTVTFADAPTGGTTATGTPILENGAITGVNITNPGKGYTAPPAATFSATGVTGTANLSNGTVTGTTMTNSGGKTFTVTDLTAYPTGDSRAAANVELHDRFGHIGRFAITAGNAVTVPIGNYRLNIAEGLAAEVTVTSTLGRIKDGSAYHIGTLNTSGPFVMEK